MDVSRTAPVIASAEATIDAPPSVVWGVLTDIALWAEWNPDVGRVAFDGPLRPGTSFRWTGGGVPIHSTLRAVEAERHVGWTGTAPLGIRAVHTWTLTPDSDRTHVRTEESFEGMVSRLLPGVMRGMLASTLERAVAALQAASEDRARD